MTAWLAWFMFTAVFLAAFIGAGWLYDRAHARWWDER